ncbi:MAG: riboflavin synthase [Pseudomonadota bacterium]
MFSGIVEATTRIHSLSQTGSILQIRVARPEDFDDIKTGDSIAFNGVCLTVEEFDDSEIQFALAAETLKVTGWTTDSMKEGLFNLERSLRVGDRVHGHMVAGHVDAMGEVVKSEDSEGSWDLVVKYPEVLRPMIWKKGSITVNGVSLTVNEVDEESFAVCLIPETLKRTNLGELKPGGVVTLEADTMARALRRFLESNPDFLGLIGQQA